MTGCSECCTRELLGVQPIWSFLWGILTDWQSSFDGFRPIYSLICVHLCWKLCVYILVIRVEARLVLIRIGVVELSDRHIGGDVMWFG